MLTEESLNAINEIEKAISYKPKKIKPREETPPSRHFKPRSDTSIWNIYRHAAEEKITDNPYYEERFLDGNSAYWGVRYAVNIKRSRWPELETKLISNFLENVGDTDDYVIGLEIEDWPEIEILVEEYLRKNLETILENDAAVLNFLKESLRYSAKDVFKLITAYKKENLIRLGEEFCKELLTRILAIYRTEAYLNAEIEEYCSIIINKYVNLVSAPSELIEEYLINNFKITLENEEAKYNSALTSFDNSITHCWHMFKLTPIVKYWNLIKNKNWPEFKELINSCATRLPSAVFYICTELELKISKDLEERSLNNLIPFIQSGIAQENINILQIQSRWGHRGNPAGWGLCQSLLLTITEYMREVSKDRMPGFENLIIKTSLKGPLKEYCSVVKQLVKEGNTMSKESEVGL
jgi:hypothetical protein